MYSVTDLGILPGYRDAAADKINNNGDVLCSASGKASDYSHSFLWRHGARTDIGTLGGETCVATDFNDAGQVVGVSDLRDNTQHAFLWEQGQMSDLGSIRLSSINRRGQAAGEVATSQGSRALIWENGQGRDISGLLPGMEQETVSINDGGQVAGNFRTRRKAPQQFAFYFDGVRSQELPSLGGSHSRANAMNSHAAVVGSSDLRSGKDAPSHAFCWQSGTLLDLDTQNSDHSWATGINDRNQIVGGMAHARDGQHACLWEAGEMSDLNTRVSAESGWILYNAASINDKGQIVGTGLHNGKRRAFLLTPSDR